MLRIFLAIIGLCALTALTAQIGFSAQYLNGQGDNWTYRPAELEENTIDLPGTGWQASIDYWFRLKNVRVEFLPTLAYGEQSQTIGLSVADLDTDVNGLHFFLNTNLYLFDMKGDCDCPTFSKEGPSLQKGFYLQLSPGYSYFDFNIQDNVTGFSFTDEDYAFSMGLGLGLDLGLSDFITLTPHLGARYYPSLTWETLDGDRGIAFPPSVEAESSLMNYYAGVRLGFRFDR